MRNLGGDPFDQLAAVLFDRDFDVFRAAIIPLAIVKAHARTSTHTNSEVFHMRDDVWSKPGVLDVTTQLREAVTSI